MSWLLHNVIADMYGPHFLAFYATVIGVVIIACYRSVRSVDRTGSLDLPEIPAKLDPYEIAYLRGGENEVTRAAIASLIQRGLLKITERKRAWRGKIKEIDRGREPKSGELAPIESGVLQWSGFPAQPQSIFQDGGIPTMLTGRCVEYETKLAQDNLLAPRDQMKEAATRLWWVGSSIILALGGYKLWVALMKGHTNVAFLFIFGLLGVVALAIACMALLPRVSRLGKAYLSRLQLAYSGLKAQVKLGNELDLAIDIDGEPVERKKGQAANGYSDGLLLVGIYGITVLAGTPLSDLKTMFAQGTSSGGGCGGGCGGGGGGCGGGGCGGGCGGCGG